MQRMVGSHSFHTATTFHNNVRVIENNISLNIDVTPERARYSALTLFFHNLEDVEQFAHDILTQCQMIRDENQDPDSLELGILSLGREIAKLVPAR